MRWQTTAVDQTGSAQSQSVAKEQVKERLADQAPVRHLDRGASGATIPQALNRKIAQSHNRTIALLLFVGPEFLHDALCTDDPLLRPNRREALQPPDVERPVCGSDWYGSTDPATPP